jgi:protein SCO1/2
MINENPMVGGRWFAQTLLGALFCSWAAVSIPVAHGLEPISQTDHSGHARHQQMLEKKEFTRILQDYQVPDVTLTDQDGQKVSLRAVLEGEQPVMLNFIYTTCTTICPVLSASFAQVQKYMAPEEVESTRMVSISIDPEHDTPLKLKEYARRFRAGPGWEFFTGDLDDIVVVLTAFDAYRGDKMNHIPLTFLRATPNDSWVRIEGFASSRELLQEYRTLTKSILPAPAISYTDGDRFTRFMVDSSVSSKRVVFPTLCR